MSARRVLEQVVGRFETRGVEHRDRQRERQAFQKLFRFVVRERVQRLDDVGRTFFTQAFDRDRAVAEIEGCVVHGYLPSRRPREGEPIPKRIRSPSGGTAHTID